MIKVIFALVFLLFFQNANSQSFIDSAIQAWNGKNLVVLQRQVHYLTNHAKIRKIQMQEKGIKLPLDLIAEKSIHKAGQFSAGAQVIVYASLGEAYVRENAVANGYHYLREARKIANGLAGLPVAYLLYKYAQVFQDLNRLDSAILYSEKALNIAHELKNDSLEQEVLQEIAFQCFRSGNYDRSMFFYTKILGNPFCTQAQKMGSLNTIGLNYTNLKLYDSARNYYARSLRIAEAAKDTAWIGLLNGNIGHTYYLEKKYELAIPGLKKDYEYSRRSSNIESSIRALSSLLNVFSQLSNLPMARLYYDSLKMLIELSGDRKARSDYLLDMANYFEKIGDLKTSNKYLRLHQQFQDSLRILRNGERTAELEAQFEFDRQANKINELENQANLQSERDNRNRIIIFSLIAISIVGGAATILLYNNYRLKKETNQLLETKNIEINSQRDSLHHLNETKNKLFSIIGHDLRGPINSLKGLLGLVNKKLISADDFHRMTRQLQDNVEQVHFTLNNLLYWANGQLQGIKPDIKPVNLNNVVTENMNLLEEMAMAKGIDLRNQVGKDFSVLADADLLRIVVRNLVSNAIKFTPSGGQITVNAAASNGTTIIAIADTGIGMSEESIAEFLQSKFVKSQSGTSGEKGTGLGLHLSQEMIEKIGGSLSIDSHPSRGTTVKISLPSS